jgi:hypothetical protein
MGDQLDSSDNVSNLVVSCFLEFCLNMFQVPSAAAMIGGEVGLGGWGTTHFAFAYQGQRVWV